MADARISTPAYQFGIVTASPATTYTDALPTTTKPTTTGATAVLYDAGVGNLALVPDASLLNVVPFANANNYAAVGIRLTKWTSYTQTTGVVVWVPITLLDATLTYSTTTASIPNLSINGTQRFFYSAITSNAYGPVPTLYSPGTALAATTLTASVTVDPLGAQLITAQFKTTTTSSVMGILWNTV